MACETVITNVPPVGQGKPTSRHNGGGFVRFENCGSWDFWIHDVNANCNSIYNLAKINCIPLIDFLTTPLQVDVDANGHTIYNVGKILIGSSTDDGSGALLQVAGEINAQSYMLGGYEFASYATPGQIDLSDIYSINGVTGFLPAGPEGSIQYNDDGNFAGDSFLVYDETTHNVGIVPLGLGPQWRLDVGGDINIIDPTYTGYAYRINGIPFAIADAGGSHINLINIGLINGAPPGGGGGGGALPGGQPGNVQFNVTGGLFGGSNNLFWDNTNNRLGIGTATPAYPLDVVGNENITGCYYIAQVPFACQSGSGIALQNIVTINGGPPGGAATTPGAPVGSIQYNQANVFTGSNNLTWDWINNRMGIGTFAPGYPLDVVGNVNARGCYLISGLTFACSDGAGGINLTNITNINGQPPGTGGGASVVVGDTPPANPQIGNLWFDSVGTQLYIWYTDPTSSQWVATINQCGSGGSGGGGVTDPAPPVNSVQFNNAGVFGGSANLTWNNTRPALSMNGYIYINSADTGAPVLQARNTAATGSVILGMFQATNPGAVTGYVSTSIQSMQFQNIVYASSYASPPNLANTAGFNLAGSGGTAITFASGNVEYMRITSTGLVGISNYAPTYQLDVNSAANAYVARFQNTGTFSGIIIDHLGTSGGESVVSFRSGGFEAAVIEYDSDEDTLIFWTGAQDAANSTLCCDTNSRVGIMNTSPAYQLDVNGDVNTTGVYRVNGVPLSTGGSQTPWTSNIDGGTHGLFNISGVTVNSLGAINSPVVYAGGNVSGITNSLVAIGPMSNPSSLGATSPAIAYFGDSSQFVCLQLGVSSSYGDNGGVWMQAVDISFADPTASSLVLQPIANTYLALGNKRPTYKLDVVGDVNITGSYYVNGLPSIRRIDVALTAAQIDNLFTTPVIAIPAPPAGKANIVIFSNFEMRASATAFTGGGGVQLVYTAAPATNIITPIAAFIVTAVGPSTVCQQGFLATTAAAAQIASAVQIQCSTANFAGGTGTAVFHIWYTVT